MRMPNFLIIGAEKAGTTALYQYLKQHPEVYMSSIKEPKFFAPEYNDAVSDREAYSLLFQEASAEVAIGEASPQYLNSPNAPNLIKQYVPEVKLIAIIRQPVERAYSHYNMLVNLGYYTKVRGFIEDFRESKSSQSLKENYSFKSSFYFEGLNRYFSQFNKEQIRVYLYEDFKRNSHEFIKSIFDFLGIDNTFLPNMETEHNKSFVPKNQTMHLALHGLRTKSNYVKTLSKFLLPDNFRKSLINNFLSQNKEFLPKLPAQLRKEFTKEVYYEDILKVERLLGVDLSEWLV